MTFLDFYWRKNRLFSKKNAPNGALIYRIILLLALHVFSFDTHRSVRHNHQAFFAD